MAHWLMKSEPSVYPWAQLVIDGHTWWDGVRNFQAAANLRAMALGDTAFFYHSNEGKEIVGVMTIAETARPDHADETGTFVMVGVKPVIALLRPVTLAWIKTCAALEGMALLRQSRLSVSPVSAEEWAIIRKEGGLS